MSEATTYRGREQMDAVKAKAAQAQAAAESRRTNALTSIEIEEAREKAAERASCASRRRRPRSWRSGPADAKRRPPPARPATSACPPRSGSRCRG